MQSIYILYTFIVEYYSVMRKKEILPFVTTYLELEGIMLNEISQTEKIKYCKISLICGIKKVKLIKTESRMVVTGGLGVEELGKCLRVQAYNQQINKFWRANAQHRDYSQQYCIINYKTAYRLDPNCFHHKKRNRL